MFAEIPRSAHIERVSVHSPRAIKNAKKSIKKGFQIQMKNKGFAMIEVLSTCPTGWGMTPVEAVGWLEENMIPYYPLGVYKTVEDA